MTSPLKYSLGALLLSCIAFSGCMNKYERRAIGYYEVDKFEGLDSTNKIDLPTLVLSADKTFVLTFLNKKITGKWEADDYGDWILADFYFDNHHVQCQILGQNFEIMEVVNPQNFSINAKSFSFKRVKKH